MVINFKMLGLNEKFFPVDLVSLNVIDLVS